MNLWKESVYGFKQYFALDIRYIYIYETGIFYVETGMKKGKDSDLGAERSLLEYNLLECSPHLNTPPPPPPIPWKLQSTPDNSRTFKGNRKRFELSRVRVIGRSKTIGGSKERNSFYCTVNILITLIVEMSSEN